MKGSNSNASLDSITSLQEELELLLLQEQQHKRRLILERERDLNINRSGSAPPSVEGALRSNLFGNLNFDLSNDSSSSSSSNYNARTGVLTEEEIRSHPAYLEYYYSNENLNPRLPPPLLSKEDWRAAQKFSSLFSAPPGFSVKKSGEDELIGLRKAALRNISRKNSAEMLDKVPTGSGGAASGSGMKARRKSFADIVQEGVGQQVKKSVLSRPPSQNSVADVAESSEATCPDKAFANARNGARLANNVEPVTSDAPKVSSSGIFEIADYSGSFSGLSMPKVQIHPEDIMKLSGMLIGQNQQQQHYLDKSRVEMLLNSMNYANLTRSNGSMGNLHNSNSLGNDHLGFTRRTSSTSNLQSLLNPSDFGNKFSGTISTDDENLRNIHLCALDPRYIQYIRGRNLSESSSQDKFVTSPPGFENMQALEKAYLEALLLQQKQHQYQSQLLSKPSSINDYYSSFYDPLETSKSSLLQKEKTPQTHTAPTLRTPMEGESKNVKGQFELLLDLVKSNKAKSLELSDVLTHVVEFSKDQYGSRFIQQKLETATVEEKTKIFREIVPHACALMIDVFGNYVIQKFFEHGTDGQRKELAGHVIGHVLPLSLQMYGCRVIQKALEVVDMELQAEMVKELDGSVMKCVRDQNGNHVIQKCIECVPQHQIQFITSSFVGDVVTLSTHPYGCRVIQRVLEHCADLKTQQLIMDEILSSVCDLAQDQYGNYVIQHVLQYGKPHERSVIIGKLAGQIVKMSQQKFASNVVEKCLTFGGPDERKLLVNEILGSTDENEPLQAMVKDPFGNYVVQKVLETCDDQNRELILSRIKVHLSALKKYTYGKHIVSRIEKLVATGERQAALSSSGST